MNASRRRRLQQLVVVGDIILKVQGIPVGEAADRRRVRDILDNVPLVASSR